MVSCQTSSITLGRETSPEMLRPGDFRHQVLRPGNSAIVGAAEPCHQETQQVHGLVAAATSVQALQDPGKIPQPRNLDGRHLLDLEMVNLEFEVDRPAGLADHLRYPGIGDQRALRHARFGHHHRCAIAYGVNRQTPLRVVRHQ